MSKGIGAHANKILEDATCVVYEYGGYNLNDPAFRNEARIYDGEIIIQKDCFVEPEIHEKLKKTPSGKKKLVIKRIPVSVDYGQMLNSGRIQVTNCSNCWQTSADHLKIDIMVCHLLFAIFRQYQEDGAIPETISYNV